MASAALTARRALAQLGRTCNASAIGGSSKGSWSLTPTLMRRWFSSLPPHEVVGMPSLSPTMEAGSIAKWNLNEGDAFSAGDIICEVETDKATVDFEAQDDGVIAKILRQAGLGEEIKVGQPIMVTVDDSDHVSAFADFAADAAPAAAPAAAPPPAADPPAPAPPAPAPAPSPAAAPAPAPAAPTPTTGGRVVASPLAHTLAKEMSLGPLSALAISGTGPGGRIIAADVREYQPSAAHTATVAAAAVPAAPTPAAAVLPTPIAGAGYTDYVLSEEAKQIAAQLARSKSVIPHYYLTVDIDVESLLALRADLNASLTAKAKDADAEPPISANDLLLKAAALSMKAVPSANASWMDSFVRVYDSVDINVVMGAGDALYAPVLRDVGRRGVQSIADDIRAALHLVQAAEEGAEEPSPPAPPPTVDMSAVGTVTVLNLGMYGIKSCAPIVREPQAVCLALGAIRDCIVPNEAYDASVEGSSMYSQVAMLTATLSCDHRVVDGAVGAQWLAAFKEHVESPSTLLL